MNPCLHKPELNPGTLKLINEVSENHVNGGGAISLSATLDLFGIAMDPGIHDQIQARDNIVLKKGEGTSGTFENQGEIIKIKKNGVTLTIPVLVAGAYVSFPDQFTLFFDKAHTIKGSAFILSASLEKVSADQSTIHVDVSGDSFDQCIIHKP